MNKRSFFVAVSILMLYMGCATIPQPVLIPQTSAGNRALPAQWRTVLVIDPVKQFRNAYTDAEIPESKTGFKGYFKALNDQTIKHTTAIFSRKNLKIYKGSDLPADQLSELNKVLPEFIRDPEVLISHRQVNAAYLPVFQRLKAAAGAEAVLIFTYNVKAGAAEYFSICSGQLAPSTSTTDMTAYLIDAQTGEVVWQNELFYRELLEHFYLKKLLTALFQDLM